MPSKRPRREAAETDAAVAASAEIVANADSVTASSLLQISPSPSPPSTRGHYLPHRAVPVAKAADGGFCALCLQGYSRYSMVKFEAMSLLPDAITMISTKLGTRAGKGYFCQRCASALHVPHDIVSATPLASSREPLGLLLLSIGLLLRRDLCMDFTLGDCVFKCVPCQGGLSVPIAEAADGSCYASAEILVRRGCKASFMLDKRTSLLLEHLHSPAVAPQLSEAYVVAAVKAFYAAGFKRKDDAVRSIQITASKVANAAAALQASSETALRDQLWIFFARGSSEGGANSFLAAFMVAFILTTCAGWEIVSGRLLMAPKSAVHAYATTSWGPARVLNCLARKRYLKSWSPQATTPAGKVNSAALCDQRAAWVMILVLYNSPPGVEVTTVLRRHGLPHGPYAVSFLICEVRKYFRPGVTEYRNVNMKRDASNIRAAVVALHNVTVLPNWVDDAAFELALLISKDVVAAVPETTLGQAIAEIQQQETGEPDEERVAF